ncbi:MAG: pyridoxamine 5'-phosphate oxidase family protein [Pseudomonadota bacterium]
MRRAHNQINDPREITRVLDSTTIGRLATIDADGFPYITPVNFVFLNGRAYFHAALKGEKLDNIARDPKVGFEVDHPLAYIELAFGGGNSPCDMHQFYRSVVIRGRARILPDGEAKTAALNALIAKHEGPGHPLTSPELPDYKACVVVEITPETMTGKADLGQNKTPEKRRALAEKLLARGLEGDIEAVRAMGFDIESTANGWRIV